MSASTLQMTAIPAFSDNYIWLLERGDGVCAVVDPGDHRPVLPVLERRNLKLSYILLTHHHADHIGGVAGLLQHHSAMVIGPRDERIPGRDRTVCEGDRVELELMNLSFEVIEVPAHTRSHIAYHGEGLLFCGDTLFSVGCGRLFEGTASQMQSSLDKIARLPPQTRVYCAHEYTRANCEFALRVEPHNEALQARSRAVVAARENGQITIPSTLSEELQVNPFLRTREAAVVAAARKISPGTQPGSETLAVIRSWKDHY